MCRLFALSADQPVTARFWLLDAPYSLRTQSRYNADGTGIGWIDEDGVASVAKRPVAAYESERFEDAAASLTARTMIAHIRLSSGTAAERANTHPFLMNGIVVAHNGVLQVTDALRERVRRLGAAELIQGTTDSEWMAALIAGEVARIEDERGLRRTVVDEDELATLEETAPAPERPASTAHRGAGGPVSPPDADATGIAARDRALHDGLVAAISWIARHVPVYSVNLLVARDHHLYALRLPTTNELWVLDRPAGAVAREPLDHESDTLLARSEDLRDVHSVVVASEPMDDDEWRLLGDGELIHVGPDGCIDSEHPFPALAHPLAIEDLGLSAAASQAHDAQARAHRERRRAAA